MVQYRINIGDTLPLFHAKDAEGEELKTGDLQGAPVVVYFYPKDDTPGCTAEACGFRDHMRMLTHYDVSVVGISPDTAASHRKFIQKNSLNFTLLADPYYELCKTFDVLRQNWDTKHEEIERSTFLIDHQGIIRWIERPVKVEGHLERVLAALKSIK